MKIKEIRIENFGRLSGYSISLNDGITTVNEENGWGKSTLAAFIKVMFFGFDGENTRKDIITNERKHYRPWQGGLYGGTVIFEAGGREYRLTRTFGSKAAEDEFRLYDNTTKLESSDYTEKIGEELFSLDADSFKKTVFISQNDIETEPTAGINAKISNLTGTTDDISNYDSIAEKFKAFLSKTNERRSNSEISRLKDEIVELENSVRLIPVLEEEIKEKNVKLDAERLRFTNNKTKSKEMSDKLKEVSKYSELAAKKDQYESIKNRVKERSEALKKIKSVFPGDVPENCKISAWEKASAAISEAELSAAPFKLSPEEENILGRYASVFSSGIPGSFDISSALMAASELEEKERQYAALQFSEEEKRDYELLCKKYAGVGDLTSDIDLLITDFSDAKSKKEALTTNETVLAGLKAQHKQTNASVLWIIFLMTGLLTACGGVPILMLVSRLAGIIMISAGGLLALSGVLVKVLSKSKSQEEEVSLFAQLEKEIAEEKEFIEKTYSAVSTFLGDLGLEFEYASALPLLSDIKNEYRRFSQLAEKEADQRDDILREEIIALKSGLEEFFSSYVSILTASDSYSAKANTLKYESERYEAVRVKKQNYDESAGNVIRLKSEVAADIRSAGFLCSEDNYKSIIPEIKQAVSQYGAAKTEYDKALLEQNDFEGNNDISEIEAFKPVIGMPRAEDIQVTIDHLDAEKEEILGNINAYNNQLNELLEKADELSEKEEERMAKAEEYNKLAERARLVSRTSDLLSRAKSSFTARYSKPVADGFKKYYDVLEGSSDKNYTFDANMNLKIEDHGDYRDLHFYSAGSQDKIGLCFRLGLIEAMYPKEKPVIIMDDPFTNLDDRRLEGGKKLLKELGKDYQVLYLTCHESREI